MMMLVEEKSFEDVLEQNYSPEMSREEINAIDVMILRLKSALKWNDLEGESWFNKERGPAIISDITTQFNTWKFPTSPRIDRPVPDIIQRLVIYSMSKICFYHWVRDSEIVANVLRQVYNYAGRFSSMFSQIMIEYASSSIRTGAYKETRRKEYLIMLFFLTHAHRAKLEFSGERFVDMRDNEEFYFPRVFMAVIYNKPQLLLLFLRHGAIVDRRLVGRRSNNFVLYTLLRSRLMKLYCALGSETSEPSWDTTARNSHVKDAGLCLTFLLRVIRQIPVGKLVFSLTRHEPSGVRIIGTSDDFIRSVSERGIVPTLVSRYFEPSGLRHLCRWAIRDALNRNWNLPFGVFRLPLPEVLQRYVNLSED